MTESLDNDEIECEQPKVVVKKKTKTVKIKQPENYPFIIYLNIQAYKF